MHALLEEGQGVLDGREDIVVGLSSQVLGQVKRNLGILNSKFNKFGAHMT